MPKTDFIRARIEPDLKQRGEAVLHEIGLSTSEAITMFFRQIVMQRGLPFAARIPNAQTRASFSEAPDQAVRVGDAREMIDHILAGDD